MVFTGVPALGSVMLGQYHRHITAIIEPHSTIYILEDPKTDVAYMLQNYQLDLGGSIAVLKYNPTTNTYDILKERRYPLMDRGSKLYRGDNDMVRVKIVNNYSEDIPDHIVVEEGYIDTELRIL